MVAAGSFVVTLETWSLDDYVHPDDFCGQVSSATAAHRRAVRSQYRCKVSHESNLHVLCLDWWFAEEISSLDDHTMVHSMLPSSDFCGQISNTAAHRFAILTLSLNAAGQPNRDTLDVSGVQPYFCVEYPTGARV